MALVICQTNKQQQDGTKEVQEAGGGPSRRDSRLCDVQLSRSTMIFHHYHCARVYVFRAAAHIPNTRYADEDEEGELEEMKKEQTEK